MSDYLNLEAGQNEILIQLKQLPTLEFNSQRLVTFSMIDTAHQRPKGTAKSAFGRHRSRFVLGRHFFELTGDVIRTQLLSEFSRSIPARGL